MCRHLAYLGPPQPLARWLLTSPHALARQAWAPRDMRGGGTVNADGFGVGWYAPTPDDDPPGRTADGAPTDQPVAPRRYRRAVPIWADPGLADLATAVHASAVLAAVRSATPGAPFGEAACAPFTDGRALFSLNGRIDGWPDSAADLAGRLPVTDLLTLEATVDSALVWALVRRRIAAGAPAPVALGDVVAAVATVAPGSRLNLLYVDPDTIVATTWTHSLWVRHRPGDALVASEPVDEDPAWEPVPDGCLVVATRERFTVSPLPSPPAPP